MSQNMIKCIVYTVAYNAEKTIGRTVESVLTQTEQSWILYIIDNGSTDRTWEIVEQYAATDSRIVLLKNKMNNVSEPGNTHLEIIEKLDDNDYFCVLDSDDTYEPNFLEKTLQFAIKNRLDIAACGTQMYSQETDRPLANSYAIPNDLLITSKDSFSKHFKAYTQFAWTWWAKLFSVSIIRKCAFENSHKVSYCADTLFGYETFGYAKRIGILGGTLHRYYIQNKSAINTYDAKRVISDQIACDAGLTYLGVKKIATPENRALVLSVYANAIKNSIGLVINAPVDQNTKLRDLRDIFDHPHAQAILHKRYVSAEFVEALQKTAQTYIASHCQTPDEDGMLYAIDAYAAMKNIYVMPDWTKAQVFCFVTELHLKCANGKKDVALLESKIKSLISDFPILAHMTVQDATFLRDIICCVLDNDLPCALEKSIALIETNSVSEIHAESYIILSQNLCAANDYGDGWIFFKKLWIDQLIQQSRLDEARVELDELTSIIPDDEELQEFSKSLSQM